MSLAETVHKGVKWRRDESGAVYFLDSRTNRWVRWSPGVDAPPLPPRWSLFGVATKVERPGWLTPWRVVPIVLVAAAVVAGIAQALVPSSSAPAAETRAAEALLGKCLAQDGTALGHPRYSASPVPCTSPKAAVKVVQVVPSTPGSPLCPAGTTGVELPYNGVRYLHVECLAPAGRP